MNSLSEIYLERMKGKDAQRQEEVIYSRANMPGCLVATVLIWVCVLSWESQCRKKSEAASLELVMRLEEEMPKQEEQEM